MRRIGYARVSTLEQDLEIQRNALNAAGCMISFEEKISGVRMDNREQLDIALKVVGPGDALVVTKLDRLGRSLVDLATIARDLDKRGVNLLVLDQAIDTSTSAGRAFFGMLAVFAEFEHSIRRERQALGIKRAKSAKERRPDGKLKYAGRKPTVPFSAILELHTAGMRPVDIARKLRVSRMSVWRAIKQGETK